MDDAGPCKAPPSGRRTSRGHVLTPRRVVAVIALAILVVGLRRHLRFVRDVFRHRRPPKLAFTVLVLLRQLRKS
jgi:hypothetical protein